MTDLPQLSDVSTDSRPEALTITEDLSLMRLFQLRAAKGEPSALETAIGTTGRRLHRVVGETVFGFRVPGEKI